MKTKKALLTLSLAGGLLAAPLCGLSLAQPPLPDRQALDAISQGKAPKQPEQKQFKQIEKALRQNMRSSETLIRAAREAGASPKELGAMEKLSVDFLKAFLAAITPGGVPPRQAPREAQPPKAAPAKPAPGLQFRGAPAGKPGKCPALGDMKPMPAPAPKFMGKNGPAPEPQGIIITAPDGSQWLVTPQANEPRPRPEKPRMPQSPSLYQPNAPVPAPAPAQSAPAPAPAQDDPDDEIVIIEEETVSDMPLWPTKDQMSKDGILKYLEKRGSLNK